MSSSNQAQPRAVVHKRILDVAAQQPTATIEEIARSVSGATPGLVERVLADFDDPARTEPPHEEEVSQETQTESSSTDVEVEADEEQRSSEAVEPGSQDERTGPAEEPPESTEKQAPVEPDPDTLTPCQRETIRTIHEYPTATQRDIAAKLDISAAAVNQRVNNIDGFEWENRIAFAETVFGDSGAATDRSSAQASHDQPGAEPTSNRVAQLENRIAALETAETGGTDTTAEITDPELVQKILHACLTSDQISTNEELKIIEQFLS